MQRKHTWLADNLHRVGREFAPADVVEAAERQGIDVTANPARWAASQLQVAVRDGAVTKLGWARYERVEAHAADQEMIGAPRLDGIPPEIIAEAVEHLLMAGRSMSRALEYAVPRSAAEEYIEGCMKTHGQQAGMLRTMIEVDR